MAAARATARRSPRPCCDRAVAWAEPPVRDGPGRGPPRDHDRVVPDRRRGDSPSAIAGYAEAIGDLEQAPPGIEEAIDPLLRRDPVGGGFPKLSHLPGNVDAEALASVPAPAVEGEASTPEQKRRLAAQLLRRRNAAVAGSPSPGA